MARTAASDARFVTLRAEGGLLPPDLLARIAAGDPDLGGWKPEDYGLARGERLNEAIARAWTNVRAFWAAFRATGGSLRPSETGVSETREQWLLPLFRELGYGRLTFRGAAEEIGGKRYAVSHQAGEAQGGEAPPIHTLSFRQDIEKSTAAGMGGGGTGALGGQRTSPHGMVQDYLNRSDDHLWGVVTNGLRLRLLRDNASLSRAAFVEFDLEAMLEGGVYADFVLLYLLLHRSRLPGPGRAGRDCWLERWRLDAAARGTRALDALRDGVETAIRALGQGLLEHPANEALRGRLHAGTLSVADYYRQLLRLVYRLLFLLAAEERDLLFSADADGWLKAVYERHYGVGRLRELIVRRRGADRHDDLWRSLRVAFAALRGEGGDALGLRPLGGGLFGPASCPDLDGAQLGNERLLAAIRGLSFARDAKSGLTRRVNYRDMDVEELGSVYEGLLELQPVLKTTGDRPEFALGASGERKSTGSYYTNDGLVRELIASALVPRLTTILASRRSPHQKRTALLALKICDPACGSGHFLLAAARRIGREVACLDTGESEPDPVEIRVAVREAIRHCVYGVDRNPLAVDLCKLALWLEAHSPDRPLNFLDHHIKQGNSLIGATQQMIDDGIANDAFEPVRGDSREIATAIRRRNQRERNGEIPLRPAMPLSADHETLMQIYSDLDADGSSSHVEALKEHQYNKRRRSPDLVIKRTIFDLWTAAFFWPIQPIAVGEPDFPTHGIWHRIGQRLEASGGTISPPPDGSSFSTDYLIVERAAELQRQYDFFHWEVEFEDVFMRPDPGFDCVVGNPPWERVKLQEQEFFATNDPEIASAPNAAARRRMIELLRRGNPRLYAAFEVARRKSENESHFLRRSGRYPLTGRGDVNTYSVFAELMARSIRTVGLAGIIVPTGIATDDTNKQFFGWLVETGRLATLFDFENREGLFPSIDSRMKFSLLTASGKERPSEPFEVAFFLTKPSDLRDPERRFTLSSEDIAFLNPNTRTCPTFRRRGDADITKKLYEIAPLLIRESDSSSNSWGIRFRQGLFDMTTDFSFLRTAEELLDQGFVLEAGSTFCRGAEKYLPLLEAKMTHQFDHRTASIVLNLANRIRRSQSSATSHEEHANPGFTPTPQYWVSAEEIASRHPVLVERGWMLGVKDVTSPTNERTLLSVVLPAVGAGNTLTIFELTRSPSPGHSACFVASLNSYVLDYITRQKLGGLHMTLSLLKQLPILPSEIYTAELRELIVQRVIELVYTAHDLASFAHDCGFDGPPFVWDEERRMQLRADLDGIYAHLYGLGRDDFAYILDTFPIVARKDAARWGEYRTKRLCLEAYDRFAGAVEVAEFARHRADATTA